MTEVTIPTNRDRKIIGVGEVVHLFFLPGSATWKSSDGTLDSNNGPSVKFTAPDLAANILITATGSGCSASVSFQVIAPKGVHMEIFSIIHPTGDVQLGFLADIYITPDSVSFKNIEVMEGECDSKVDGYFDNKYFSQKRHDASVGAGAIQPVGDVTTGKGSKVKHYDTVTRLIELNPPYLNGGSFDWPIPWYYRVQDGGWHFFTKVHQLIVLDSSGNMTLSKGGATASTKDYWFEYLWPDIKHGWNKVFD